MRALLSATLLLACAAPESAAMTDPATPADCTVLFDFSGADDRDAWRVQNDTVMGGNSRGEMNADGDALVFEGELVTRGGGFVQVQADLPPGAMDGMKSLRVIGSSEGRPWRARVQTDVRVNRADMRPDDAPVMASGPARDGPSVAFASPLSGFDDGVATATFDAPNATVHGRPVPGADWDASDAQNLGLILSDGVDGPYRLTLRRIEVCR